MNYKHGIANARSIGGGDRSRFGRYVARVFDLNAVLCLNITDGDNCS